VSPDRTDSAADATDAGACANYCSCMTVCTIYAGYPFAEAGSCMSACNAFTADQLSCQTSACGRAQSSMGSNREHACVEAWGEMCHP
jgi:hypothetical protein